MSLIAVPIYEEVANTSRLIYPLVFQPALMEDGGVTAAILVSVRTVVSVTLRMVTVLVHQDGEGSDVQLVTKRYIRKNCYYYYDFSNYTFTGIYNGNYVSSSWVDILK